MRTSDEIIDLIKKLRESRSISQQELANKVDIPKSSLSRYESKQRKFPVNNIGDYARALGVTPEYLLGLESEQHSLTISTSQIPLFSSISCGDLSSIDNDLIGNIEVPERLVNKYGIENLFAVKTTGDSMNKIVNEGYAAIFAKNVEWTNGDAVAVLVNGDEATLKKITRTESSIILEPSSHNQEHQPLFINCNEVACDEYVKVIGKLVGASMIFE